jgi:hypothetical protein
MQYTGCTLFILNVWFFHWQKFTLFFSSAYIHIVRFGNSTYVWFFAAGLLYIKCVSFCISWLQTLGEFMFQVYINSQSMQIFLCSIACYHLSWQVLMVQAVLEVCNFVLSNSGWCRYILFLFWLLCPQCVQLLQLFSSYIYSSGDV